MLVIESSMLGIKKNLHEKTNTPNTDKEKAQDESNYLVQYEKNK